MIEAIDLVGGYDRQPIIDRLSFSVQKGEIFGIIGPNGSGKTTLMKLLTGLLPTMAGTLRIDQRALASYTQKELAQVVAVLPQTVDFSFDYTVKEAIALGRYPYQRGLFKTLSENDEQIIREAMIVTDVTDFSAYPLQSLSGGEKQRVFLAQALAQQPKVLLLDEPTNHLDVAHQKRLFDALQRLTKTNQLTVIAIFHDLNIASMYCDRLMLLDKGRLIRIGTPVEVLQASILKAVYDVDFQPLPHPSVPSALVSILPEQQAQPLDPFQATREQTNEWIKVQFPIALKTFSSAVIGGGSGWKRTFVNRHVSLEYDCSDPSSEMEQFLREHNVNPTEAIGMMTAIPMEDAVFIDRVEADFALTVMVTAGVGNAVDAAATEAHSGDATQIGTINVWVFIDGVLSEEAFVQAMITSTEAKVKALFDQQVTDPLTGTIATGTPTDSLLIAATQRGKHFPYAGTITILGKVIAKTVYAATLQAIAKYKQRKQMQ